MAKQQVIASITALPRSPQDDRRRRMTRYLITMGIRLICIVLCFVVQGWWVAVFAVGAIVLPYLAVVLANVGHDREATVLRPGSIVRVVPPPTAAPHGAESRPGEQ
ncbi:MAG: hypothetical protein JWL94_1675 [Microbacteriaceae bacterium]|jgi:uncharacterized membrane protein YdbT with pleckstrin-like domain|nr:hypothetical protein [Microbacteriaceae bacterium]HEV7955874.1 DUF3099 domain-containing protein [Marisediminicola sp.]